VERSAERLALQNDLGGLIPLDEWDGLVWLDLIDPRMAVPAFSRLVWE